MKYKVSDAAKQELGYTKRHGFLYDLTYGWLKPSEIIEDPEEGKEAEEIVRKFRELADSIFGQLTPDDRLHY